MVLFWCSVDEVATSLPIACSVSVKLDLLMTNNIQNIPNNYARDQKYSCCKIEGQEAEESMMKRL